MQFAVTVSPREVSELLAPAKPKTGINLHRECLKSMLVKAAQLGRQPSSAHYRPEEIADALITEHLEHGK